MKTEKLRGRQTPNPETHIFDPTAKSRWDEDPIYKSRLDQWGIPLFPWQSAVMRDCLAVKDSGDYAYRTVGFTVPRQNGKSQILMARMFIGLILLTENQLFTGHDFTSSVLPIYERMIEAIEANEHLAKYFPPGSCSPSTASKKLFIQAVDPKTGKKLGRVLFRTRGGASKTGRGSSTNIVFVDEAQELTPEQDKALDALIATKKAKGQIFYVGTAAAIDSSGGQNKNTTKMSGSYFLEKRASIISGRQPFACWNEWGVSKICSKFDVEAILESNPSIGYKMADGVELTVESIQASSLLDEDFSSERLGYWPTQAKGRVIDIGQWAALKAEFPTVTKDTVTALGIKTTEGGLSEGARIDICAAIRTPDRTYLEIIDSITLEGDWQTAFWDTVKDYFTSAACKRIVLDGRVGQFEILQALSDQGFWNLKGNKSRQRKMALTAPIDMTQSASLMLSSVAQKTIGHFDQDLLNSAVEDAGKRTVASGGFAFKSLSGKVDVNYLEVAALALHAVMQTKIKDYSESSLERPFAKATPAFA